MKYELLCRYIVCFPPYNLVGNLSSFSKKKEKKVCVVYWSWIFFSTISSSLRTFYHGFCQGQRMIMLDFFPLACRDQPKPHFPHLAKAEYPTDYGHPMKAWIKAIWKVGPMWQAKYASTLPKNLGLGLNFRPYIESYFLSGVHSPCPWPF